MKDFTSGCHLRDNCNDRYALSRRLFHMVRKLTAAICLCGMCVNIQAQSLSVKQKELTDIASLTAKSELDALSLVLDNALDSGLTVNEAKEAIVHTYAYCGFPKALRGLQTLVSVLDSRKVAGKDIIYGREASAITDTRSKYERGRDILAEISGMPADGPKAAYAVLSPEVEVFLKEHLFCDLFERDVLTHAEREMVTVAVLASLGKGVEPMLRSHIGIAKRLGATDSQIDEIVAFATPAASIFPQGAKIEGTNFNGTAYLQRLMTDSENFDVVVSDVVFDPAARNSWHSHPGGQILIATSGIGCYQEKGKPIQVLRPGDVVSIPANVVHWHGAMPDRSFSHIAINTKVHLGPTQWYEPVIEHDYNANR